MKNLPLSLLFVATLAAATTPGWARSAEAVNFSYNAKELATPEGREGLLERIKATTQAECSGSKSRAYTSPRRCEMDLEKQLVRAIDSTLLVAQNRGEEVKIARSGS